MGLVFPDRDPGGWHPPQPMPLSSGSGAATQHSKAGSHSQHAGSNARAQQELAWHSAQHGDDPSSDGRPSAPAYSGHASWAPSTCHW